MERSWSNRENLTKNEIAKLEKDGLQIINELDQLAHTEYSEIDAMDVERLKWAGFYAQRPKNGKFLVRVKHPSGFLTSQQARVIADLSHKYGEDSIQITIRQCIQVHNIKHIYLKEVYDLLTEAGLTSVEGCGDVPRNVLGNPLAGVDPDELFDTTSVTEGIVDALVGNPEYSNLPRKYKISVSANPGDCGFAGINDLAFVPAVYRRNGENLQGFHLYVGGGLSRAPKLAKKLPFFILPEQATAVAEAIGLIFRENGYRNSRTHCRIKVLVEDWGIERFGNEIEKLTGPLRRGGRSYVKKWNRGVFTGIHCQKQEGLNYAGLLVPSGGMQASDLREIADLADRYGNGELRTTNSQNILILNIPDERIGEFKKERILASYPLKSDAFTGYCASCTGNQYCSFATTDTKAWVKKIVTYLHEQFPDQKEPLRVNVTGCIHSCAHPQIADIGITGGRAKVNGETVDAFTLQIGGSLGRDTEFAKPLTGRISEHHILDAVKDLVTLYQQEKKEKEVFYSCVRRIGAEPFQQAIEAYTIG